MKERPILFSGAMVRALLAGAKTQTRRVVKDPPRHWSERLYMKEGGGEHWEPTGYAQVWPSQDGAFIWGVYPLGSTEPARASPYGVAGDRLWVRESFAENYFGDAQPGTLKHGYKADWTDRAADVAPEPRWTPSIHMPRWASRITLEVTSVRAERLQSISEEDAKAEGLTVTRTEPETRYASPPNNPGEWRDPREAFRCLWDYINGERAPWATNPFCWVVSFRRLP